MAALDSGRGISLALIVLLLGGLSDLLGQSVVLFANRVRPGRFVFSLITAGIVLAFSVAFWAGSIWLAAWLTFDSFRPFREVLTVVYLSYAPLILGVVVFLPYLGNIIFRVLRIWIFLALLVAVQVVYPFSFWQAILCCSLGWIVYELATRLPVIRAERLSSWWWRFTTGTPEPVDIQAMADQLAEQGRLLLNKQQRKVTRGGK